MIYFLKKEAEKRVIKDLNHMIYFFKNHLPLIDENYQGSEIKLKILSQMNHYLKNEPVTENNSLVTHILKNRNVPKNKYPNLYQLIHNVC